MLARLLADSSPPPLSSSAGGATLSILTLCSPVPFAVTGILLYFGEMESLLVDRNNQRDESKTLNTTTYTCMPWMEECKNRETQVLVQYSVVRHIWSICADWSNAQHSACDTLTKCAVFDQMVNSDAHLVKCINKTVAKCSVIIKTKPFKTKTRRFKTKTWPLTTKLTQQLKDRDTNTVIPNLYISGDIKMLNMLVKYSAWSTARDLHNVRAATVYWKTSTLSIKSNHSLHLQLVGTVSNVPAVTF